MCVEKIGPRHNLSFLKIEKLDFYTTTSPLTTPPSSPVNSMYHSHSKRRLRKLKTTRTLLFCRSRTMSKPDPDPINIGEDEENSSVISESNNEASAADIALVASKPLTYFNTKNGPFYTKAKEILQTDDFEAALSMIETGITTILSMLPGQDNHEALGPLYYMYGTTLLYSVEESKDGPEASVMAQDAEQAAGDLEIAWENLETASNILTKLECQGAEDEERMLDLAQIHCRLADLSRHNGHYEQAIQDYESCCEGRRRQLEGDKLWDRRIADVEYSLGMTSLLLAAEGEKNLMDKEGNDDEKKAPQNPAIAAMVEAAGGSAPDEHEKVNLSPEEISAQREKSIRHYVQCARILAGIIASKTGADPIETSAADESLENNENKKCSSATGTAADNISVQEKASNALNIIRDRVSKLKPSNAEDTDSIFDLTEMLDEIQETVDNCETDREGLRDVNKMRMKAEDDIKKADATDEAFGNTDDSPAEGSATTIGFGNTAASAGVTSIGFGAASTTHEDGKKPAVPMMVVKKKKKAITLEKDDSKRTKTE